MTAPTDKAALSAALTAVLMQFFDAEPEREQEVAKIVSTACEPCYTDLDVGLLSAFMADLVADALGVSSLWTVERYGIILARLKPLIPVQDYPPGYLADAIADSESVVRLAGKAVEGLNGAGIGAISAPANAAIRAAVRVHLKPASGHTQARQVAEPMAQAIEVALEKQLSNIAWRILTDALTKAIQAAPAPEKARPDPVSAYADSYLEQAYEDRQNGGLDFD